MDGHDDGHREDQENGKLLDRLFDENYGKLSTAALGLLSSKMAAENLVQETFYDAARNVKLLKLHPAQGEWLLDVLTAKTTRLNRRAERLPPADWEKRLAELLQLEERYGITKLDNILQVMLNPYERLLFDMYYLQAHPIAEIADVLRTSEESAAARLAALKKKLALKLGLL
ncbi:MAG: hypothetical protein LBQ15_10965 [Clostridium sp.]|jgi:RNA polymerase sigma factor (sigma-70 family)|nr:hypothetical protein [Clostridium sp.]